MSLNIPHELLDDLISVKGELNNALPRLKEVREEKVKDLNQIAQSLQKLQNDYTELKNFASGDAENAITLLQNRKSENQSEYCTRLNKLKQKQLIYDQGKEWQKKAEEQKKEIEEKRKESRSQLEKVEAEINAEKERQRTITEELKETRKLEEEYEAVKKELKEACQITETFLNLKMAILADFSQDTQKIQDKLNELDNIYASVDRNAIQEKQ